MGKYLLITMSLVLALGGCWSRKKSHHDDPSGGGDPVYQKELAIDSKVDGSYVFKSEYVLPAQAKPDPDYTVELFDNQGGKLDKALLDFQSYGATPRPDGLNDVKIMVPFRITNDALSGFKIRVTVKSRLEENGAPTVMETKVTVAKGLYLAPHRKKDSPYKTVAVLTESVFKVRSESGLLNLVERALTGDEAADNDAEQDLMAARGAFDVIDSVIIQKADAVLSVTNPGAATVRTNGFKLTAVGGDWSSVTIEVGRCKRPFGSALCNKDVSDDVNAVELITLKAPKIIAQKVEENGKLISAFDGSSGATAISHEKEICAATIGTHEEIPSERRVCDFWAYSGSPVEAHVVLKSSMLTDVKMPSKDFRDYLSLKELENAYYLTDAKGQKCTEESCVFDFDKDEIEIADGVYRPSKSFKEALAARVSVAPPSALSSGKYKISSADKVEAKFNFAAEGAWQKYVTGYSSLWKNKNIRDWADASCLDALKAKFKQNELLTQAKGIMPDADTAASRSIDLPKDPAALRGVDATLVSLSEQLNIWAITGSEATASVDATTKDGRFEISVLAKNVATGQPFVDNSLVFSDDASGRVLTLQGKALETLRPVMGELEIEGYPGGSGYKTPNIFVRSNDDIAEQIKTLTGKPGPRGDSFKKADFNAGEFTFRYYSVAPDGSMQIRAAVNAQNLPCQPKELEDGLCFISYNGVDAAIDSSKKGFTFKYRVAPIVAKYNEPWVYYPIITGVQNIATALRIPDFAAKVGLEKGKGDDIDWGKFAADGDPVSTGGDRGVDPNENKPSLSASFYGLSSIEKNPNALFNFKIGGKKIGGTLGKVLDKGEEAGKAVVDAAVVKPTEMVLNAPRELAGDQIRHSSYENKGLKDYFQGSGEFTAGRFTVDYGSLENLEKDKVMGLDCNSVPGFSGSEFAVAVDYTPQGFWVGFDPVTMSKKNAKFIKRPLNLKDAEAELKATVDPMFTATGKGMFGQDIKLFNAVATACDTESCWSDLEVVGDEKKEWKCKDVIDGMLPDTKCELKKEETATYLARVYWFRGQTGYLTDSILNNCNEQIRIKAGEFDALIESLVSDNDSKPFVKALSNLSPSVVEDLKTLENELSSIKDRYFSESDVSENLRKYLAGSELKSLIVALSNIKKDSPSRSVFENKIRAKNEKWETMGKSNINKYSAFKAAHDNWSEHLPDDQDIINIESSLKAIVFAMEPKIKELYCSYELQGSFKYYPSPSKIDLDKNENGASLDVDSISLAKPSEQKATDILVQSGKTWQIKADEVKIRISKINKSALTKKVTLSMPSNAVAGEMVNPDTGKLGTCSNLGQMLDQAYIPAPRFMFEKPCEMK